MKCFKCQCSLNHLQLKDVSPEELFRVDCYNPNCQEQNWLSKEAYFELRKEIVAISDSIPSITTKLPSEMNILIISMERSGSSWFAAHISTEHLKTYGILPLWNHEINQRYINKKRYDTPIGWTSVVDVDPMKALEKDFDKIIIFQKDRKSLKKDICSYNHPDKDWNDEFLVRIRKNIDKWWDIMFGREFNDPRIYKLRLEDLNNHTEWEWDKLLDFLNFPTKGRSHVFAVNPDRDWQVFSDVLPTGHAISPRLQQLQNRFTKEMVEQSIQEKFFFTKQKEIQEIKDEIVYPFVHKINPYLDGPVVRINGDIEGSSLKILVIGHHSGGLGCHFAENIHGEFLKLGHDSKFISCGEVVEGTGEEFRKYKIPIKLSSIIKERFDFVFIDQNDIYFKNDVSIPVLYNNKYIHRVSSISQADVYFFLTQPLLEYCSRFKFPYECYKAQKLEVMLSAISPKVFYPQLKALKGVIGIGDRFSIEIYVSNREILQLASLELIQREINEFKDCGFKYYEEPISDSEYRELLMKCEATWFPFPYGQFFSRRMLEAMMCKTLFVFKLHSPLHEQVLRDLGFVNGEHYVGVDDISEIEQAFIETTNKEEIVENAYKLVLEKHTYANRAKQIIEVFNKL